MKNINKYLISTFSLIIFFNLFIFHVFAANIGFSANISTYNVGSTINVKVYVSSNSSINAIAANIQFPKNLLSLLSISKTGSIINLWAQEPVLSNTYGTGSFEGVVLKGYSGNYGKAVTLVFRAKAVGKAMISFKSASILANDGNGTEVLNKKGVINLNISKATIKPVLNKNKINTNIIISVIKNRLPSSTLNKFLITSPQIVSNKSYSIQIDDNEKLIWIDDGTHVYQAPQLINGPHVIKVMAVDLNSNSLSGFLNFSTIIPKVPVITYYPKKVFTDEFIILKGIADSKVNIEIAIKNIDNNSLFVGNVSTNNEGEFIYVPNNKLKKGKYSIIARSVSLDGVYSGYMEPIYIESNEHTIQSSILSISNLITMLIPLISIIAFLIIILLYFYRKIKKHQLSLKREINKAGGIISKRFKTLDIDLKKEISIFEKIRDHKYLNKGERVFLAKFKEDIKETEILINKEIDKINKLENK